MSSLSPLSARAVHEFDLAKIRRDFPILSQMVHGLPLVYLDNAATKHKPRAVIESIVRFYEEENSNVHRGLHILSERATARYEGARKKIARFLNAERDSEIVFVRGTTEAVNLVARSFCRPLLSAGDEILITQMEHHSNIVPWQMLREETGAVLKVVPIDDRGDLILDAYERMIGPRTRMVSVVHQSNSLGTINPIERIIEIAHAHEVPVFVDGAQAASHLKIDVRALNCDFYGISAHKMYGPTGIGALYGRAELMESMPPYQGGGDMISSVTFEKTTYNRLPYRFEAGTPNIAGAIGLGAAIDYLNAIGLPAVAAHEDELLGYATAALSSVPGLRLIGTAVNRASILSFVLDGIHPHDIGTILDREGIAIRAGHHCTQPIMQRFGIPATARASLAVYNTKEEIDALVTGIHKVIQVLS